VAASPVSRCGVAVLLLSLCLGGCVKESSTQVSGGSSPGTVITPPPTQGKRYRIAVVPKGLAHDFWKTVHAGASKAGDDLQVDVEWNGPENETQISRQIEIIDNYLNSGVDALVLAACDKKALVPTIQKAAQRIPVLTIDSGVDSDISKTFIGTDNVKAAGEAAAELNRLLNGRGDVGLIPFIKNAATSDMREEGFKEGLKQFPGLHLVATLYSNGTEAGGQNAADNMLTAHPDLKGIFAANEPGAIGCARAIETRGKAGQVKLVSFDASPTQIQMLEKGTIDALIVQNPFKMGYEGVANAVKALKGESIPKRIDTGVKVVKKANLHEPEVHQLLYPLGKK